jgi:hypothetical protein
MKLVDLPLPEQERIRSCSLGQRRRLELFKDVCSAVHHAHQTRIVPAGPALHWMDT